MAISCPPIVEALVRHLQQHPSVGLHGAHGGHLAFLLAHLQLRAGGKHPLVIVTAREEQATHLARDVAFFAGESSADASESAMALPRVMHLPEVETTPYAEISPDRWGVMQRMGILFRLSQGYAGEVLVTSAAALRRRVVPRSAFSQLSDLVQVEEELDRDELAQRLLDCGFVRTQVVEDPGTFALRGGIVDLFPPLHRFPARIELFGDLVESIRLFDPASQRTLRSIDEVMVHPVRETIRGESSAEQVRQRVLAAADAVSYPSSQTRRMLEALESGQEFFGIEALTPAFHQQLVPVLDYLPESCLWVVDDPEAVTLALEQEDQRSAQGYESRLADGRLTFAPDRLFVAADELVRALTRKRRVEVRITEGAPPAERVTVRGNEDVTAEMRLAQGERGQEILRALAARIRAWCDEQSRPVLVGCGTVGATERLAALLKGYGLHAASPGQGEPLLGDALPQPGQLMLSSGQLGSGFRIPEGLVVLAEEEIFGPKGRRRPARPREVAGISDLGQLAEGEPAVHSTHGIGIYRGLQKLELRGVPADFLLLEYAGGDRLYLPVYRMSQVQRYVGGEGDLEHVKLDRLGGVTWERKKRKVKGDVRKMAEELLQLYAQRAALSGTAYPEPDAVYREFEATFPFTETPDQLQAVDEVVADLTAATPMDRLVCGDVGFGKTEVALRAAFLVAMAGRQVALLAPTTVLVEQHQRSFADRFGRYPLRVESVSRFRARKELTQVLADLRAGKVDVVVGTHRLLQSDVQFKDLGLVVVDEEHRFGVAHKERLKRLRTQVDVLTMTATPIPRTLHMGMLGLRAISIISTPPVDRLAIRTFVCRFDESLVAEAIRKELARGGQVFFVHNRVRSIEEWATRLRDLVPEARVVVGHGQMDPRQLERVMVDFVGGKHDILVCTTIVESGLDIPRANTMFINRADQFGLAQLYQLRGRIGRSRHRAFCYLLVPGIEAMSSEARQRLLVLQRFTELGSGFNIASHDLEIRGAGELLGGRQSGQIAAVGFETYARILEEAVAELRGDPITREADPEINSQVAAFIPDDYVEDVGQRLDLYKRLSSLADNEDALRELLREIRDRYGPEPAEVEALGELMVVKGLAARLGATVVDLTEQRLSLTLGDATPLTPELVVELVRPRRSRYRLTPEMRLIYTFEEQGPRAGFAPLESAKKVLRDLQARVSKTV